MGCSSSREALGRAVPPAAAPAERRQGLRSRTLSALTSIGMCRGRNDGVHPYVNQPLPEEAVMKGSASGRAEAEKALLGEDADLDGVEDAASATSSWTAQWQPEPPAPSQPPAHAAADLVSAILPGLRQIVVGYPSLLYPEHDFPVPPETVVVETCDVVDMGTPAARDIPEVVTGIVRARVDEFHEQMEKKKKKKKERTTDVEDDNVTTPRHQPALVDVSFTTTRRSRPARSGSKPVVVLYFTSLRGVRQTFEDCRAVRAILRCYRVRLDERDVSMHAAFKAELRGLLGAAGPALPRVFIDGHHDLGGAEDVRALHEAGELARALAGCEVAPAGRIISACAACGDARFALCETCHGSCKVFVDDGSCRRAGRFQRCPDCNENGLIRCPVCCY